MQPTGGIAPSERDRPEPQGSSQPRITATEVLEWIPRVEGTSGRGAAERGAGAERPMEEVGQRFYDLPVRAPQTDGGGADGVPGTFQAQPDDNPGGPTSGAQNSGTTRV